MARRRHRRRMVHRTPDAGPIAWAVEGDARNLLAGTALRRAVGFG